MRLRTIVIVGTFEVMACTGPRGADAKPCTVSQHSDGSATISCPDGTAVTLQPGTNGADGVNGSNGANGLPGLSVTSAVDHSTSAPGVSISSVAVAALTPLPPGAGTRRVTVLSSVLRPRA